MLYLLLDTISTHSKQTEVIKFRNYVSHENVTLLAENITLALKKMWREVYVLLLKNVALHVEFRLH